MTLTLKWRLLWFSSEGGFVQAVPQSLLSQCESLLNRIKARFPQFEMDGTRNVWIVKPGAKSRGRGDSVFILQLV